MIEFLSKWIEGIAIAAIIVSIFEMIIPNGNLKKYIKIILGIYIIFSIISPFVDKNKLYSVDISEFEGDYFNTKTDMENRNNISNNKNLDEIYIKTFEEEIKKEIERKGYNVYKCTVKGIFDADNKDAGISKIEIVLDSKKENLDDENGSKDKEENSEKLIVVENVEKIENIKIGEEKANDEKGIDITSKDISELKKYLAQHYELDDKVIDIDKR